MALPGEGELRVPWQAGTLPPGSPGESGWRGPSFTISSELSIDRRRIPRDPPAADADAGAGDSRTASVASGLAQALVPVARRSDRSVLWLEEAARTDELFKRMGETLLANPLDPRPVPALERRAAATGNERLLAELYEALLEARPDHPSRETLMRRIDRLRPSAAVDAVLEDVSRDDSIVGGPLRDESISGEAAGDGAARAPVLAPTIGAQPVPTARFALVGGERGHGADLPWDRDDEAKVPLAMAAGAALTGADDEAGPVLRSAPLERIFDEPDAEEIDAELGGMIVRGEDGGRPPPSRAALSLRRLGAWAIDGVLLAGASGTILLLGTGSARDVVSLVTGHPLGAGQGTSLAGLALAGAIAFVYLTLCWSLGGRTLGGSLAGVRAVDRESGAPLAVGRAALRAVFAIAGTLAFLAGPLWALVDRDGEALHDKLARSAIVPG